MNLTQTLTPAELESALQHFYGSENSYYRQTPSGRIDYTDGIRFLQQHGCYWLIDAISIYQTPEFKAEDNRQFWKLIVDLKTQQAKLICDDGNGKIRVTQEIPYTDFPLPEIKIYVEISDRVFLCLMSEY
jgi:hypothetical protein